MSLRGLTIAFDLDGTLVDTAPDLIGSLNQVLSESSLPAVPLESARYLVGRGARVLIERGFASAGAPLDPQRTPGLLARFLEIYRSRIALESQVFEGVGAALDALASDEAILCVCTNKPTDLADLLLSAVDLKHWFASIIGADSAPRPKPDASHLDTAVTAAGGTLNFAMMVGDSETDVATARAAKTPVIVVPFGYTEHGVDSLGADRVIRHFSELPAAVRTLLPALNRSKGSAIGSPSCA